MRMSEAEFLNRLNKAFPEKVIFAEQARLSVYLSLFVEIRRYARGTGVSSVQWLTDRGFIWKETGYVEPDMHNVDKCGPSPDYTAFELGDYVFRAYPLAGEYHLTDAEDALLYQSASETVKKVLIDGGRTSVREDAVLVLETINLLKGWSSELADEETSGSLWNYIFLQYGFNPENSEAAANRLYNYFRGAIKGTLAHYKRFFAPEGTQRYYTSLLLHALAPKQSIESLYSILFDFYVKNLDFQYVTEDISYKVFTKGMRARWDSRVAKNDELQLRADAIFSGLQTLFKERPGYMAVLCDSIVKKMDAILRNENTDLIDPDRNYWDTILVEWYQRKSSTERVQAQGEQRQRKTEYVATTTDRIYAQYTMEHSSVGIAIPKIRLSKIAQQRPVIKIYQSEICIYNAELSVTGDELCLTTRSRFIPFEEMSYDFSNTPAIRVEIHYDGELLYNSAEKLYRQYILLDASGAERTPHCGTIYLFASNLQEVTFPDDTDGIYSYPYPGQLYRINLDEVSSAAIDGREIFVCASTAAQFRHHTSLRKAVSAQVIHQGVSFDIFPAPFQLFIVLPEGEKSIRYQFSIDGMRHNADAFCGGGNELEIPSENDGLCHCVRIIDLATDLVKYEFNYIVLADFNVTLNAPIYYADGSQATANISFAAKQFHYSLVLEDTSDSIIVPVSGMTWQLELYIPLVHCALMGHIGFLVRNNVLPKYGFPVDTVELIPDINAVGRGKALQLARDLQMAIAEYAPGAEVVADGKMYVSRYIRKMPGKNADAAWEKGFYCPKCPTCGQPNFTKDPVAGSGRECVSCHTPIKRLSWRKTLEPRMGFCAEKEARPVPMHRPEHDFKTDDYYIGDPHRNLIAKQIFEVNGQALQIESTSNDSLVVIGQTDYKVCPACGYASETGIPLEHKNSRGYRCVNKEGNSAEYRLSHDFKTDVAKITFATQEAADINVMLSVLYALLEGLSREMEIERTDIKGC